MPGTWYTGKLYVALVCHIINEKCSVPFVVLRSQRIDGAYLRGGQST